LFGGPQRGLISKSTEGRTRLNNTGSFIAQEILSNVQSSIEVNPNKDVIEKVEQERKKDQQGSISGGSKRVVRSKTNSHMLSVFLQICLTFVRGLA